MYNIYNIHIYIYIYKERKFQNITRHAQWKIKAKNDTIFPSLVTTTVKIPCIYTFCYYRLFNFLFSYCEPTHYPQSFYLDTSKDRQVQVSYRS